MRQGIGLWSLFVVFCISPYRADATDSLIVWNGEVRVRGELDGRDFISRTPGMSYTLLRTRIGVSVNPSPGVKFHVVLQDGRVFGTEKSGSVFSTSGSASGPDLHEGYLSLVNLFVQGLDVLAGRMSLSYGSERIIGVDDWGNTGRVFDGILLRYHHMEHAVDLFVTNIGQVFEGPSVVNPFSVKSVTDSGQTFAGAYYSFSASPERQIDAFVLHQWNRNRSVGDVADLSRFTVGTFARGQFGSFYLEGDGALQFGSIRGVNIRALLGSGTIRYQATEHVSLGGGIDVLSGSGAASAEYNTFDPMFPSAHRFYGFMDYFNVFPQSTQGRGLTDFYIEGIFSPENSLMFLLRGYHFLIPEEWGGETKVGQEVDITFTWNVDTNASVEAGASCFIPGPVMRSWYGSGDTAWWGYLTTRAWF